MQLEESEALVAQIEARWAARRRSSGTRRLKTKGAMSERRRERDEEAQPWLAAPWARRDAKEKDRARALLANPTKGTE